MATKVKLQGVRLSFPKLFEAEAFPGTDTKRYGARFLIPKGSDLEKAINAAVQSEAQAKYGKTWQRTLASIEGNSNKFCWLDGDKVGKYESEEGHMLLSSARKESDGRPIVLDRNKTPLQAKDGKPYAGCYVNATVEIWAQDGQYTGMRCTLLGVQFDRDGDSFGGAGKASDDDFDDLGVPEGSDELV